MSPDRVLVIGYRGGLIRALRRLGIPFALWAEKPIALRDPALHQVIAEIPPTRKEIETALGRFDGHGQFTHVIAGTEASVYAASIARRLMGARKSRHSVVIKCHDKLLMKSHLRRHGIPMTDFLPSGRTTSVEEVVNRLGVPVVVKERSLSGGRGITFAKEEREVTLSLGPKKILEKFVDAPEASIESFVNRGEILFTNTTQYLTKGHVNLVPSHLPESTVRAMLALNRRVIEALNISWGITHLEVYLPSDGPLFGEIALRPPGGYIMELLSMAYGFDAWEAFVAVELDREFAFPRASTSWSAAQVLHPGEGTVRSVSGAEELAREPGVKALKLKIGDGERVLERMGVGEEVGHVLYEAATPDALRALLTRADSILKIEMEPA